jgi:TPR repeat protein
VHDDLGAGRGAIIPSVSGATRTRQAAALVTVWIALGLSCRGDERPATRRRVTPAADRRAEDRADRMLERAARCDQVDAADRAAACDEACELGHSNSCTGAGALRESGEPEAAWRLHVRACDGGSGLGCEAAARMRRDGRAGPADPAAAERLDQRARFYLRVHCEQRHGPSCLVLGRLFTTERGGPADGGSSATFLARACSLGVTDGCPPPVK